jgi:DNA (cytosine-5)-methyltransferase 1
MKELSLFSGAGGGLLGTKLLGWNHVGYVEYNDYCQRVIRQRILDGILENAPIFGDIRTFIDEGYAASYQGMVDVVTAGFPCQPFSVAGKQQGEEDERNMWPETLSVLRTVRPRYALLENVSGLFAHEYARRIFADLAESGFDARWRVLSAAEVGAPHKRDRVWIVADSSHGRCCQQKSGEVQQPWRAETICAGNASYTERNTLRQQSGRINGTNWESALQPADDGKKEYVADNYSNRRNKTRQSGSETLLDGIIGNTWWSVEPDVGRVADGVASRVDRLKALGNGQVPAVVTAAWKLLISGSDAIAANYRDIGCV